MNTSPHLTMTIELDNAVFYEDGETLFLTNFVSFFFIFNLKKYPLLHIYTVPDISVTSTNHFLFYAFRCLRFNPMTFIPATATE